MDGVSWRIAREEDLPQLVEIYNQAIADGGSTADLEPYSVAQRRDWFEAHRRAPFLIYVLERHAVLVGYFYFSPWRSGRAALRNVAELSYYLARAARGQGLGRYLLAEAEQLARANGLRYLLAILLESNLASRALLERGGFALAGALPQIAELGNMRCGQLIMYRQLQEDEG